MSRVAESIRVAQAIGLWLPTGREGHAAPDPAVVDDDYQDHLVGHNCYRPSVFRMVVEITSSDWRDDLERERAAYTEAQVPVYVIGDRKHGRVLVLTDPVGGVPHPVRVPAGGVARAPRVHRGEDRDRSGSAPQALNSQRTRVSPSGVP